jgi:hypothetical protein
MNSEEFVDNQDFQFGLDIDEIALASDPTDEEAAQSRPKSRSSGTAKRKRNSANRVSLAERLVNDGASDDDIKWDPNDGLPHTGKWPLEEEKFAYKLIRDFEAGVLDDCPEGTTLRSYLAKTLRCAPMRVSKKFAGKCIGSKTFTRKPLDPSDPANGNRMALVLKNRKRVLSDDESSEDDMSRTSRSSSDQDFSDVSSSSSDSGSMSPGRRSPKSRRRCGSRFSDASSTDSLASGLTSGAATYRGRSSGQKAPRSDEVFCIPPLSETMAMIDPASSFDPMFGFVDTDEKHFQDLDAQYDEWRRALSYFCTDDGFAEGSGGMKRTQSTVSLMF